MDESPKAVDLDAIPGAGGVVWSTSPVGFHANLVVLGPDGSIDRHRNDDVDVLLVVLAGAGLALIDDRPADLSSGTAVVVPSGAARAVHAGPTGLRYLSVHGTRTPLHIGRPRPTDPAGPNHGAAP